MSQMAAALSIVIALLLPQAAFAWNATGHQIVGSIADQLLTTNTPRQVTILLGVGPRAAVRALIVANNFPESKIADLKKAISHAYTRGLLWTYTG